MTTVKVIETVGSSTESWDDAIQILLKETAKTVRNITGIDILGYKLDIKDNKIAKYKVHAKIAFCVDRE